ncbi:MAG: sigma-70 family RNA polymerase sigma factor [Lachnospiraceae bacterium]|nr:sigma-70 family RNA polymerase sigma factor [Lachnospiraceae bacterium]
MSLDKEQLFTEYYSQYFDKLKIYAYSSLGNWTRAEEAVQDTFHIAWIKIDDFLSSENPMGWLINTLKYTIKNIRRSDSYQMKLFISLSEITDISASIDSELDIDVDGVCQSLLSKDDYYLLRRVVLDKATYKEMSKELGIKLWACQKRMQRIYQKLKEHFDKLP